MPDWIPTTKEIIGAITTIVGLPASAWGLYRVLRYWKTSMRDEPPAQEQLDKERAYLAALQGYLEELDRPLGFAESEYTPLAGSFVGQESISLRFRLRNAT